MFWPIWLATRLLVIAFYSTFVLAPAFAWSIRKTNHGLFLLLLCWLASAVVTQILLANLLIRCYNKDCRTEELAVVTAGGVWLCFFVAAVVTGTVTLLRNRRRLPPPPQPKRPAGPLPKPPP